MAASINEERKNPPNNGEECPGQVDNDFDREVFIEEIRNLPCLWNTSIAAYRDRMFINCRHYPSPLYLRNMIRAQDRKKEFLSARKTPPSGKQPSGRINSILKNWLLSSRALFSYKLLSYKNTYSGCSQAYAIQFCNKYH